MVGVELPELNEELGAKALSAAGSFMPFSAVAILTGNMWETSAGQRSELRELAAHSDTSIEDLEERSQAVQRLAELRTKDYENTLISFAGEAGGAAAATGLYAAIFSNPLGWIGAGVVGVIGTVTGSNLVSPFLDNTKEKLVTFFKDIQHKSDERAVRGEDAFAHGLLSMPPTMVPDILVALHHESNGSIKNMTDLLDTLSQNPPDAEKLAIIRKVQMDPTINGDIAQALGIKPIPGVLASDQYAAMLNTRPPEIPHITILDPEDHGLCLLKDTANLHQEMRERNALASKQETAIEGSQFVEHDIAELGSPLPPNVPSKPTKPNGKRSGKG